MIIYDDLSLNDLVLDLLCSELYGVDLVFVDKYPWEANMWAHYLPSNLAWSLNRIRSWNLASTQNWILKLLGEQDPAATDKQITQRCPKLHIYQEQIFHWRSRLKFQCTSIHCILGSFMKLFPIFPFLCSSFSGCR